MRDAEDEQCGPHKSEGMAEFRPRGTHAARGGAGQGAFHFPQARVARALRSIATTSAPRGENQGRVVRLVFLDNFIQRWLIFFAIFFREKPRIVKLIILMGVSKK